MERIICSAIIYDDGKYHAQEVGRVLSGIVIAGRRHANCYHTLELLVPGANKSDKYPTRDQQGFITSTGRYVDRKEAYIIAKAAGQCSLEHDDIPELISEDLY